MKTTHSDTITRDPVCGMLVDPTAGKPSVEHDGHTIHFCSRGCADKFAADPQAYIIAEDPVCGMDVNRATARHMAKHQGGRFYFCSSGCQDKFEAAPETYLSGHPEPEPMPEEVLAVVRPPSVTTKGGTLSLEMVNPCAAPQTTPTSSAAARARNQGLPL